MSTAVESPSVVAAEKQKRRKDKADKKDGSKKRKRDSEHHEPDPEAEQQSSKKKRKRDQQEEASPFESQAPVDATPSEKRKKEKSKSKSKPSKDPKESHPQLDSTPSGPHKRDQSKSKSEASTDAKEELLIKHSPFFKQTTSFYLPLSPCASAFPLEGLCAEHLSPLLLTYYPPLRGIILAYEDVHMSTERPQSNSKAAKPSLVSKEVLAKSIDEYGVTFVWLTAEFILFRPKKGTWIEGFVNLQNESLLGLVCYNYFNAVVEREKLPQDWKWVDDESGVANHHSSPKKRKRKFGESGGYFVDGKGVEVEGRIVFRVEDFEANAGVDGSGGSVSIVGTMQHGVDKT